MATLPNKYTSFTAVQRDVRLSQRATKAELAQLAQALSQENRRLTRAVASLQNTVNQIIDYVNGMTYP